MDNFNNMGYATRLRTKWTTRHGFLHTQIISYVFCTHTHTHTHTHTLTHIYSRTRLSVGASTHAHFFVGACLMRAQRRRWRPDPTCDASRNVAAASTARDKAAASPVKQEAN